MGFTGLSLEGRFFDVNPALITMLGYDSAEEVLALDPTSDVFADPGEQARVIREFQRGARLDNVEVRWKRKDGSAITVRLSGRAVSRSEETAEVLELIAEDITERRVLENQFLPGSEDGGCGTFGRWGGPRFQQFADGDQRLCGSLAGAHPEG